MDMRCSGCGAELEASASACARCGAAVPGGTPEGSLERRQLTVLFCDLVGSTALSERLELEELHGAIMAYQSCVDGIVAQFGGFVARRLGDGIVAFFGYPLAQEDDAERAVRAALAIVDSVAALRIPDAKLQVRIGLATGTVVIGANAGSQPPDVTGEAPGLAVRVQSLAEAGTVVIADSTRRLVGSLFELQRRAPGASGGPEGWRAVRPVGVEGRFEALRASARLPLVGREAEMGRMLGAWRRAADGVGQVVLLNGEPGIGKSRIVEALRTALGDEASRVAAYSCAPGSRETVLGTFVQGFRAAAGLQPGEPAGAQIDRLSAWLEDRMADPEAALPWIAELLSVPGAALAQPVSLSTQRRKEVLLDHVLAAVAGPARHGPMLLLVEDLHWADPTSLELLGLLVERVRGLALLLVATARPEFIPPWAEQSDVVTIAVPRLDRRDNAAVIRNVVGGKALPDEVTELILSRTDGVPLFVEELTKATLESGLLREGPDGYALTAPFSGRAIPSTLQGSLMARLDRLGPVKAVAQIGAAIGRTFSLRLLSAVAGLPEPEVGEAVGRLEGAGLVERQPAQAGSYTFRHALVQDVAYASLLREDRIRLHGRIAAAFERLAPDLGETEPELLARHYAAGGVPEKAIACWLEAAEKARQRSALEEAVGHLTQGLAAVGSLPPSPARDLTELDLRAVLGITYMELKGWPAAEVEATLAPAHALCRALGDTRRLPSVLRGLWQYHATRGDHAASMRLVADLQEAAARSDDPTLRLSAAYAACATRFWGGRYAPAAAHARDVLRTYEFERHRGYVTLVGSDPKTTTLIWESYRLWIEGYPDQALEAAAGHNLQARRLGHPFNLCLSLTLGAAVHAFRRDDRTLDAWAAEAHALAREQSIPFVHAVLAPLYKSIALMERGALRNAFELNQAGLAGWRATGGRLIDSYHQIVAGDLLGRLGRPDDGLEVTGRVLDAVAATNERWAEPELWRVRGSLHARKRDGPGAKAAYETAIRIAREQGARSWELRAATGLAGISEHGSTRRALLEPLLSGFSEGRDTPDVAEAIGILEAL